MFRLRAKITEETSQSFPIVTLQMHYIAATPLSSQVTEVQREIKIRTLLPMRALGRINHSREIILLTIRFLPTVLIISSKHLIIIIKLVEEETFHPDRNTIKT